MSDIFFPDEFFKTEYRNNFAISEVMKRSWASDMEIISEVKRLCEKHSLKMFACYGTLLGAIRDHGFIPWDDDIDVGFVGDDYARFLEVAKEELGEKYRIINPYTREWYSMNFTHVTDAVEPNFERNWLKSKYGCPFGTGPDIYPYYYIPRNPDEENYILDILSKIDNVMAMNRQSLARMEDEGKFNSNSGLNETIAINLIDLQHETGYEFTNERPLENQLEILYDQVCRVTEESDADYVCRYDEYTKDKSKKFPKEYFQLLIDIPFEKIMMPVPIGYDAILRARYGDNYILHKREAAAHGYPYFRKQLSGMEYFEEQLKERKSLISDFGVYTESEPIGKKGKSVRLLYHTNIVEMLINSGNAIEKIKKVLAEESSKEGIEFWWMPGVFPKSDECAWDEVSPDLIAEYEGLIRDFHSNGGKICSISEKVDAVTEYFDEYYGDESIFTEQFRSLGKKVEIQEYAKIFE